MNTTRLSVALLLVIALSASLAQAGMMPGKMTGMLMGAKDHHASGTVTLVKENGHATLRLDDLNVDKVPDGRVYLAHNGDYADGVELGKLTQFSGTVQFAIPAAVNPAAYDSVVIWCKQFSVEIGRAALHTGDAM